jgi:N-acetylglucosamine kinase-like BadF-type ATPase
VGDEGSAYWLGRQALRALVRQLEQRGPSSALADTIAGSSGADALRQAVYERAANRRTLAALAPLVTSLAESGDEVARAILAEGAKELAQLVVTSARSLGLDAMPFPLALAGGVLTGSRLARDLVAACLTEAGLRPQPQTLVPEPVAGCVRLAERFVRLGSLESSP